jgi:hypothetical protein
MMPNNFPGANENNFENQSELSPRYDIMIWTFDCFTVATCKDFCFTVATCKDFS